MRTDSTNLSAEAVNSCKSYILDKWGKKYLQIESYNKNKVHKKLTKRLDQQMLVKQN